MYADCVLRSFKEYETHLGPMGAVTQMDLVPKDADVTKDLVNFWAPEGAQVSAHGYGYLMVTEGENFSRWHSDFGETLDSLITLYGCGRKIWFFVKPGLFAQQLEAEYATAEAFIECLNKYGQNLVCCTQEVGDSVYLPYGWIHCVVSLGNVAGCASLLSVGLRVPQERAEKTWKTVASRLPIGQQRLDKYRNGPDVKDYER